MPGVNGERRQGQGFVCLGSWTALALLYSAHHLASPPKLPLLSHINLAPTGPTHPSGHTLFAGKQAQDAAPPIFTRVWGAVVVGEWDDASAMHQTSTIAGCVRALGAGSRAFHLRRAQSQQRLLVSQLFEATLRGGNKLSASPPRYCVGSPKVA